MNATEAQKVTDQMYTAAKMILYDQCPPTRAAYMCIANESEEPCCESCWSSYLTDIDRGDPPGTDAWRSIGRLYREV